FTGYLLAKSEGWPLLFSILKDKDSRKIFYFMMLNFGFMKVQMVYGIITGSLGLLSDSIHMLFDCLALAVGLCAAVMSKWPPSERFPYGYGKIDTLAGFANGAFL
ncbi:putative zinc transporter msc2, partial [Ascosphaera acerosa]